MNCPNCGYDAGVSKFCPECGTKLNITDFDDNNVNAVNEEGLEEKNDNAPEETNSDSDCTSHNDKNFNHISSNKRISLKKVLMIAICVLIAVGLLITGASIQKNNALTESEKTAVKELVSSIDEIPGDVAEKDESLIKSLKEKYSSFNEKQQKKVKNYKKIEKALEKINEKKVKTVEDAIAKIGKVTINSGSAINNAETKYYNLPEELKKEVSSYDTLTTAKTTYEKLCAEKTIKLIDELGEITLESESKLDEVGEYYNCLSSGSKALVTNYSKYSEAVKKFNDLKEAEKERKKAERLKNFKAALSKLKNNSDQIRGYTWYEPQSRPYYADTRSYFLPYFCTDTKTGEIVSTRIHAHYTGDNWIFWTKLTINIDGTNYYKTPSYFNVERDHAYGNVWEYYDYAVSDSDIEMLRAIADSKKTIVRFEGDQHYKDVEVTAADKEGIRQFLTAYDIYYENNID